jgi:hypothetical protein
MGRSMPEGARPMSGAFEYLYDHEIERIGARGEALAKYAATDESVCAFRDRFIGGETLSQ